MLVKAGYNDTELGEMKMERIYKLNFLLYVDGYTQWYQFEKNKGKKDI